MDEIKIYLFRSAYRDSSDEKHGLQQIPGKVFNIWEIIFRPRCVRLGERSWSQGISLQVK